MPAINALRITGPRYNKQLKFYLNSMFDFNADHTLLSMINSGGKGVLLQLLFQVVLPMVSWGKEGTSTVRHFFYDEKGNFKPYPFYVSVEWVLDTTPKRYLVTGIAFFATKSMKKEDNTENVEVDYTTFVREYGEHERFTIRDLSYYDEQNRSIMPYKEWCDLLRSGADEFRYFTNSSKDKRRYKETLASYGIYADDWAEMVKMNRNEAGIQDYFEKVFPNSRTNMGLFKELLIPTIAERMHNDSESNTDLAKLFKDAAVIAEQLPFLRNREEALHVLIEMCIELELAVSACVTAKEDLENTESEGVQLFRSIEELLRMTKADIAQKQTDQSALQKQKEDFTWQQSNLGYVRALRAEQHQLEVCKEAENRDSEAKAELKRKQDTHKKAQLQKLRKIQHDCWQIVQNIKLQMDAIENSAEVNANKQKLTELRQKALSEWNILRQELQNVQEQYEAYNNHLTQSKTERDQTLKNLNDELIQTKATIQSLATQIDEFESKTCQMENLHGVAIRLDPEGIFKSEQTELESRVEQVRKLSSKIEQLSQESTELFGRVQKEEEQFTQASKAASHLYEQYHKQYQSEETLTGELIRELRAVPLEEVPVPEFLRAQKAVLKAKIQHWEQRKLQFKEEIWTLNQELDLDLGTDDSPVWVPNASLLLAKQKLEKRGFAIMLGTEYVHHLEISKRRDMLASFPLLPYALVAYKNEDIQSILQADLFQDDVHFSPVPLYAAERLEGSETHLFAISANQAYELSAVPGAWDARKQTMIVRLQDLTDQMGKCQKQEEIHRQLLEKVKSTLLHTTSTLLLQEYEKKKSETQHVELRLQESRNLLQVKVELVDQAKEEKEHLELAVRELRSRVQELETYVTDYWRTLDRMNEKDRQEKQERSLGKQYDEVVEQAKNVGDLLFNWSIAYSKWNQEIQGKIEQIRFYVDNAALPSVSKTEPSEEPPHLHVHSESLLHIISTMRSIDQDISMNNAELIRLQTEMKRALDDLQKAKDHLEGVELNWDRIPVPIESVDWLERRERVLEEEVKAAVNAERAYENALGKAQTSLDHLVKDRQKAESSVKNPDPWGNVVIEAKELEIERGLAAVEAELQTLATQIKNLQGNANRFELMHNRLEAYLDKDDVQAEVSLDFSLLDKIRQDPNIISSWNDSRKKKEDVYKSVMKKADEICKKHLSVIEGSSWDEYLKEVMVGQYRLLRDSEPEEKLEILKENRNYALFELEKQKDDIGIAEEARRNWGKHASKFCISIIKGLREMTQRMSIRNRGNHKFDLLRLRHAERLPKLVEDIEIYMFEFFDNVLKELLRTHSAIEGIDMGIIKKKINPSDLVFAALHNQFPILEIYNLNTDNTFLTEQPLSHYFTEWETMNTGSHTETAGSGGQLVAARTLVMMMLLTFKRKSTDQRYSVLISDNPFANAISPHVVDPIFVIADLLKFQWLVVTPPELVKLGISQKFPVYCSLDLQKQKSGKDAVTHHVHHGFRKLEQAPRLI
ncbi:hypothetical protein M0651_13875 [Paenibacillus sp. MBLB2552]|uniref:Chromosome segregation ATPase n=1 Tax=Paenibacillus mellifer TaxID=2937794 RepID=A0A9X1XZR3_9BACL|nr:hypothetical protein [Paenibacillus mellifer]MCK8488262.1 hypothetical protein [Paenibacillus mellifer]